MLFIMQ